MTGLGINFRNACAPLLLACSREGLKLQHCGGQWPALCLCCLGACGASCFALRTWGIMPVLHIAVAGPLSCQPRSLLQVKVSEVARL